MDCFLYDIGLRHERVKISSKYFTQKLCMNCLQKQQLKDAP